MHEGDQRSAIRLHGSPHLSPHLRPFSYRIYSLPRRAHPFILSKYVHLLVVIEVYSKWCGPVATVGSAYKALRAKDDEEAILTFHTVVAEDVHRTWEPENPKGYEHLDAVFARHGKSEPMFLIYRNGMLLETLKVRDVCGGSDHPHNPQRVIQIHQDGGFSPISPLPRTRLSFPFFFCYPSDRLQCQNTPLLVRTVEENWPQGPDGDDLANNGMLLRIKEREAPPEEATKGGGRRRGGA